MTSKNNSSPDKSKITAGKSQGVNNSMSSYAHYIAPLDPLRGKSCLFDFKLCLYLRMASGKYFQN